MSENLEAVLETALRLPLEEQRQLAEQLPAVTNLSDEARLAEEAEWVAIVEGTRAGRMLGRSISSGGRGKRARARGPRSGASAGLR
jgi:hypothetical protein